MGVALTVGNLVGTCQAEAAGRDRVMTKYQIEQQAKREAARIKAWKDIGEPCIEEINAELTAMDLPITWELPGYHEFRTEAACESALELIPEIYKLIVLEYACVITQTSVRYCMISNIEFDTQWDGLDWPLVRTRKGLNLPVKLPYHFKSYLEMDKKLRNRYILDLRRELIIK